MTEEPARVDALVTAFAVLQTCRHILTVSTDLEDARRQLDRLLELVRAKAAEERVPDAMLREAGRQSLMELL